ncbi:MAG: aminotransferase IV [Phycisphaerae bacterium]|nr:aminotransferase IV [Phycisphaerae bacterium]
MLQTFDDRNRDILLNINGELVHRDKAGVSPFDSSVQGGDAVWEGLRLYQGRIFKLTEHLDRLHRSAVRIGFDSIPSMTQLRSELARTLEANSMTDGVHVRLTITRGVKITSGMDPRLNQSGPTLIIVPEYKSPVYSKKGLSLATSSIRRHSPDCLDAKIHHNNLLQSIMAKIEANAVGADDALMLDVRGFVAETNATHLFLVKDGGLHTSTTDSCPEGITRQVVLDICAEQGIAASERDIRLEEFHQADEVFCTGTMGELAGVTSIDGTTIGDGSIGPMTMRLSELFQEQVIADSEPVTAH